MFDDANKSSVVDDSKIKEAETLQILVSAGYFRARIKGLNTFDKVIGGMTWCIQGCSMNIDIDLLFHDGWNIGKKISLTEKIVKVLRKMNCPHQIEPHQIQGSDFEHIYPVVQWLVRKTLNSQDNRIEEMKSVACQYFDRNSSFDKSIESINEDSQSKQWKAPTSNPILQDSTNFLDFINKTYWPNRKYKKPESMKNVDEKTSVTSTLLEYGKKQYLPSSVSTKSEEANQRQSKSTIEEEENVTEIQAQMSSQLKESSKMAAKLVSRILEMKKDDLNQAVENYEVQSNILMQNSQTSAHVRLETIEKTIQEYNEQMSILHENKEMASQQLSKLKEKRKEMKQSVQQKQNQLQVIQEQIDEAVKICPVDIDVEQVEEMVKKLEGLKESEIELKNSIKENDDKLNEELLRVEIQEQSFDEEKKIAELTETLNRDKKRFQTGRLKLAKKTRELKQLQLFLDDIPSKREIQQYQKRFVELNDQINLAYSENKQLYDMYNILDSVKDCLQREVNLLNSIYDNFKEAIQHTSTKEQMIKQMEQVANTIRDLKKNGENQTEKTKADRDLKRAKYNSILEQTRDYARLTKQMQDTWQLYEKLMSKAQEMNINVDI